MAPARRRSKPAPDAPSANSAAGESTAPRRRPSTRRAEVNDELVAELRALRAAMDEMIERYRLRVGGRLADLILLIAGDSSIGAAARPLPTRDAEALLEEVREASIKPGKGRAKDFRRLESLVEELTAETGEH